MRFSAEDLLSALLGATPRPTALAPRDARGLYGLVDHLGDLRYIGATKSEEQSFHERIHQRHGTGPEDMSHYFSFMYNTGRMWRDRDNLLTAADGKIAKALRNEFVVDHCRAVWLPLPETADIAGLEAEVIALAPDHVVAWNRRRTHVYQEPVDLVDATLSRLGWGPERRAALERQRLRWLSAAVVRTPAPRTTRVPSFPEGPFRFFALDVETANHDRASICQIGVACVRPDNSIETWTTYVDPQVEEWAFTHIHGISADTVRGAPGFAEVLPVLRSVLNEATIYQHSGFDRSAIAAACNRAGLPVPDWTWRDSVQVARAAWPDLRGNGGHGLGSLKTHLGLQFEHHDAGEDARAAAEVVLHAEQVPPRQAKIAQMPAAFDVIDVDDLPGPQILPPAPPATGPRVIGTTVVTQANIDHNHLYLRSFIDRFPADAIGGSNAASAALREVAVDWGGPATVMTDLDGQKKFFRRRGWIREFFARRGVQAGDSNTVEEVAPYRYRLDVARRSGGR